MVPFNYLEWPNISKARSYWNLAKLSTTRSVARPVYTTAEFFCILQEYNDYCCSRNISRTYFSYIVTVLQSFSRRGYDVVDFTRTCRCVQIWQPNIPSSTALATSHFQCYAAHTVSCTWPWSCVRTRWMDSCCSVQHILTHSQISSHCHYNADASSSGIGYLDHIILVDNLLKVWSD